MIADPCGKYLHISCVWYLHGLYFLSSLVTIDDSPQPDQVVVTDNDTSQPDQVQYAVVDRNTLMRNRNQTDKGTDGATKNKNGEHFFSSDLCQSLFFWF